jgi:hypothetical protein
MVSVALRRASLRGGDHPPRDAAARRIGHQGAASRYIHTAQDRAIRAWSWRSLSLKCRRPRKRPVGYGSNLHCSRRRSRAAVRYCSRSVSLNAAATAISDKKRNPSGGLTDRASHSRLDMLPVSICCLLCSARHRRQPWHEAYPPAWRLQRMTGASAGPREFQFHRPGHKAHRQSLFRQQE